MILHSPIVLLVSKKVFSYWKLAVIQGIINITGSPILTEGEGNTRGNIQGRRVVKKVNRSI